MGSGHKHQVCTYEQAEAAIRRHETIYLNDCYCRRPAKDGEKAWEYCGHDLDTCMGFHEPAGDYAKYGFRIIRQQEALEKFEAWKKQGNFFRFMEDEKWVCFCCACGCEWFRDKEGNLIPDKCDKSSMIEKTDEELCNECGECVAVCAYHARII
ncbi:MAG: hypothetical protein KJ645_11915, partial [Planctomycetes bacterium]|nr:hypothetical protein [Planctomycetota bacterium]